MNRIQLTNLQRESELNASELNQVVGGDAFLKSLKSRLDENTSYGAVNSALLEAAKYYKELGDMDKVDQLIEILQFRWLYPDDSVTQIIFPF